VDEKHARVGGDLMNDVLEEDAGLLSSGESTKTLTKREDIVIDGLGEANHAEVIVVLLKVGGKISGSGVGIITTDGVEDIDLILDELVSAHLTRILALLDQATLEAVSDVAQLHTAVADGAATVLVKEECVLAHLGGDLDAAALKKTLITIKVADDANFGSNFSVTVDQCTDAARQARGKTTSSKNSNLLHRHYDSM